MIDFPRLNSTQKIIALILTGLLALGGTGFAVWSYYDGQPKQHVGQFAKQSETDPSFFKSIEMPKPAPEEPKQDPPSREILPPPPAPASAPPLPAAPPPRPLQAQEIFRDIRPVGPDSADPAQIINAQRRGSIGLEFKDDAATAKVNFTARTAAFRKANSSTKWEEDRTEASLPVDMSRVINVAKHIPAILENEINSALPGKVVATIEENIYGSHGRLVLIPGGSKAVGRFQPLKKQGETRLEISWERIITYPDGIDIPLVDAEMSDAMGRSGITGELDSRFMDRYGMALFVSILGAVAQTQIPVDNRAAGVAIDSIGNTSASLAKTILDKNIDLKPIVVIPQGTRVTISARKDVWFKPAADGKVQAVAFTSNGRK